MQLFVGGLFLLFLVIDNATTQLALYSKWSRVIFKYDENQKVMDVRAGRYRPGKVVIFDSQLHIANDGTETLFVTTPDLFGVSPFTLSMMSNTIQAKDGSNVLIPFPDESWRQGNCSHRLVSVFGIKIDPLKRLWVIDSGMVKQMKPDASLVCPPKVLVFDLNNNNQLLKMYEIPNSQHYDDSLLVNVELDIRNEDGSDTMAYLSDVTGYRMLVYNMLRESSYAIANPFFNPFPIACFFRDINGKNFTLFNGLNSIALGAGKKPDRPMFFQGVSSTRQGIVSLSTVNNMDESQDAFQYKISGSRGYHSTSSLMSPNGFLIFNDLEKNSIVVWDSLKSYSRKNFVTAVKDDTQLQFVTGMQLLGNNLLLTSSRYQNVITGHIEPNHTNYRVLVYMDFNKFLTRN